jgi:hypothetical protein
MRVRFQGQEMVPQGPPLALHGGYARRTASYVQLESELAQ